MCALAAVVTTGCRKKALDDRDAGPSGGGGLGAIGGPSGGGGVGGVGSFGGPAPGGIGGPAPGVTAVDPVVSRAWTWRACGTTPVATASSPHIVAAQFAADDRQLALFWSDGRIVAHALPIDPLAPPRELRPAGSPATIVLSPDWSMMAEAGTARVILWRVADGQMIRELVGTTADCWGAVPRFSAAGDRILYGPCVWNVADGAPLGTIPSYVDATFRGDRIVTIGCSARPNGDSEGVCTYDLAGNELSRRALVASDGARLSGAGLAALAPRGDIVFWPATKLAPTGNLVTRIDAWDTDDGQLKWTPVGTDLGILGRPTFSADGDLVLFPSYDPTSVLRVADGTPQVPVDPEISGERALALSADGRLLASGFNGAPELRETETAGSLRIFGDNADGFPVTDLSISNDGSLLASLSTGAVGWRVAPNFADSAMIWRRYGEGATNVAVSPDGRLAAVSGDIRLVFSGVDGRVKLRRTFSDDGVDLTRSVCIGTQLRFSADGRFVAGKGYARALDVFDTTSFAQIASIPSTSCAGGIAFSRDGALLATSQPSVVATADWSEGWSAPGLDRSMGQLLSSPRTDVEFSPDGRRLLITTCGDAAGCQTSWWNGASLPGLTARRPHVSAEGHWIVAGGVLLHEPSGETRTFDADARVAVFAPNGDIITGRPDGSMARFCRGP